MPKYKVGVVAEWEVEVEADGPYPAEAAAMEQVEGSCRWGVRPKYFTAKPELIENA